MNLSEDLAWRGLIKDKTFDDIKWLDNPRTFYLGTDPSSDSLTIGNLAVIILARRLAAAGWKAVLLVGGATMLIGDPGGKDEERTLKSKEEIDNNLDSLQEQLQKLFAGQQFELVNNYDWLAEYKYLDFLRDVGKHFSMSELMQRDFVSARMGEEGSGISYAEFSYSLLQGYDFWWLYKNKGVCLQIGASDQWGNMLSGVPLIRKKEGQTVHAMSMPLVINKSTGKKFGKSEEGAIWLDPAKTTPTQFYQFWINASDTEVEDYLKIFTMLGREEIEQLMAEHSSDPGQRKAQNKLAQEVTLLVHGQQQAQKAAAVTRYLTSQVSIGHASEEELELIRQEIPSVKASAETGLISVLVSAGLAASNSEARRLVESSAIYINNQTARHDSLQESDFKNGRLLIRRGKAFKDSALIEK